MYGWEERISKSHEGVSYWHNRITGESLWTLEVRASHLLVKHKDSRRPSGRKGESITRTKEAAIGILREYEEEIHKAVDKAEKFRELAMRHSDCSSAARAGDLNKFTTDTMQKPFEEAAFALRVGEISGIVTTDSGVHLIMRTE